MSQGYNKIKITDKSGYPFTSTVVGAKRGLDVNLITTDFDIRDLSKTQDSILIYANTVKNGTGTDYIPLVDSAGHLQIDVLSAPTTVVTQSGTWNIGTLTGITNTVTVDGTVTSTPSGSGVQEIEGDEAEGSGSLPNPILIGGDDGTDIKNLAVNSIGYLQVTCKPSISVIGYVRMCDGGAHVLTSTVIGEDRGLDVNIIGSAAITVDCNSSNVTIDNAAASGVYVRPGTSATWDISDRAARLVGKVYGSESQILQQKAATNDLIVTLDGESVAVTGSFYPVTQPISGTVTANAGTNLNTSALLTGTIFTGRLGEVQATPTANTLLSRLKTIADNQLADGHNVTIDNGAAGSAVNIQDGGNTITVDGTVTANAGTNLNTSALATSAKQLADGHNVTIDNISTNEVYVRGSGTAGTADAAVLTVQGIASGTALAVTESSPISGFATSAKQLAAGHTVDCNSSNVTVDNAAGSGVYVREGTSASWNIRALTVSDKVSVEPDGTALSNGQVSVDTTVGGVEILAASAGRAGATITNQGSTDCYIGTGTVSTSNGTLLKAGDSIAMPTDSSIKAIVASGSTTCGFLAYA